MINPFEFAFDIFVRAFWCPLATVVALLPVMFFAATCEFFFFDAVWSRPESLPAIWTFTVGGLFAAIFVILSYIAISHFDEDYWTIPVMCCALLAHAACAIFDFVPSGDLYAGKALALGIVLGGITVGVIANLQWGKHRYPDE
jgi:uncharacterized membrane protein YdcZ (DUF606 family)